MKKNNGARTHARTLGAIFFFSTAYTHTHIRTFATFPGDLNTTPRLLATFPSFQSLITPLLSSQPDRSMKNLPTNQPTTSPLHPCTSSQVQSKSEKEMDSIALGEAEAE